MGRLQRLPRGEGGVYAFIVQHRLRPVFLQGQDAFCRRLGNSRAKEETGIVFQHRVHGGLSIPGAHGPDVLVHIIVDAIRVSQKTNGAGRMMVVNDDTGSGLGVDGFSSEEVGEWPVKVVLGKLASQIVGNIGIVTNRILAGRPLPLLLNGELGPGAKHDPCEPGGFFRGEIVKEGVVPLVLKALIGDPQLGLGKVGSQYGGQLGEVGHDVFGWVVPGVASGHKHGVQARKLLIEGLLDSQ